MREIFSAGHIMNVWLITKAISLLFLFRVHSLLFFPLSVSVSSRLSAYPRVLDDDAEYEVRTHHYLKVLEVNLDGIISRIFIEILSLIA